MTEKFMKILKISAYTGMIIASGMVIAKMCMDKIKKDKKEKMILIAKKINTDIKNIDRKISPRYHDKNQEKYDEMWGESCSLE